MRKGQLIALLLAVLSVAFAVKLKASESSLPHREALGNIGRVSELISSEYAEAHQGQLPVSIDDTAFRTFLSVDSEAIDEIYLINPVFFGSSLSSLSNKALDEPLIIMKKIRFSEAPYFKISTYGGEVYSLSFSELQKKKLSQKVKISLEKLIGNYNPPSEN